MIRLRSMEPELEYMFKHALIHDVVYNGLLKKERSAVHERIASVMETLFHDRLAEFYETIAFHFKQGRSIDKAIDYLVKSGEKNLKRYAVEESHRYYEEAYILLCQKSEKTVEAQKTLLDLLIKWASVYYYRGDYKGLLERLQSHKHLAESSGDKCRLGMYYAWLGCALWHREMFKDAHKYLHHALELGEETGDQLVLGYACTWLSWATVELGSLDGAIVFAQRAQKIADELPVPDHYMHFNSLAGLGHVYWHKGEKQKVLQAGNSLLEFGQSHFNIRSMVMGHTFVGFSHLLAGELDEAASCFHEAIEVSVDPWYSQFPRLALCYAQVISGQFDELEDALNEIIAFSEERGAEYVGTPAQFFLGAVLLAKGKMQRGMKMLEDVQSGWLESGSILRYAQAQYIMGRIYAQIASGGTKKKFSIIAKNLGFLLKKVPFARQKAVESFASAAEIAETMGARFISGKCHLSLGQIHRTMGKIDLARQCLTRADALLRECEAQSHQQEARAALDSLG